MKNWETIEADVNLILDKHYTPGRSGNNIEYIVVHHNAGNLTVEDCYRVWQTREASAHYQVEGNGRIGQLVWDSDTAWHASNGEANRKSIGIEHANNAFGPWTISDECLENGAHLVAALCKYYKLGRPKWLSNVYPHSHFGATACPGEIAGSQNAKYMERAQYWYDQMTQPQADPKPVTPLPDALKKFTDLDPDAWYIKPLEAAVSNGYLNGYPDNTIHPNDPVTRGQAVCIIANAAKAEFEHPFSDVVASPYYYDAVAWAKENGIVSGASDEFRPDDPCTREQFACMLHNWAKNPKPVGYPQGFKDWSSVSEWAQNAVAWCVEQGIIGGNGSTIRPNDTCTRAEAAAMIVNKEE